MLSVPEALAEIVRHAVPIDAATVPLGDALGRVLADDVTSGLDSPPFDKALMDGFAVRGEDVAKAGTTLAVIESVMAGQVPTLEVGSGQATRIMTGAPMPAGADSVVPIERTTPVGERVCIEVAFSAGKNILYCGESMKAGERVFAAGHSLRPQDLGVLAELGVASVPVRRRPRVAILATGDELVPPDETPGPGQIRNSNESLLVGLVAAAGGEPVPLGIARDIKEELRTKIDIGLTCDLLLLSGGVSAGDLDLVPTVLKEAGVEEVFHKVNVKPGKPVWFGVKSEGRVTRDGRHEVSEARTGPPLLWGEGSGVRGSPADPNAPSIDSPSERRSPISVTSSSGSPHPRPLSPRRGETKAVQPHPSSLVPLPTLVFGLPGNPVSVLVCFELFTLTAIRRMLGIDPAVPRAISGVLTTLYENRGDRPTYAPAKIAVDADGRLIVTTVRWAGSGDLRATVDANGVAVFEPNRSYAAGEPINALLWRGNDCAASLPL